MQKSATVRSRIEPALKHDVKLILDEIGLTDSEAIELFYRQIKLHRGIPFEVKIPNEVTLKTFRDSEKGINIKKHKNINEMFEDLEK